MEAHVAVVVVILPNNPLRRTESEYRTTPATVGARVGVNVGARVGAGVVSAHKQMNVPMMESHPVFPFSTANELAAKFMPYVPCTALLDDVHSEHLAVPP